MKSRTPIRVNSCPSVVVHCIVTMKTQFSRITAVAIVCLSACAHNANARDNGLTVAGWQKYAGDPVLGGQYGTCFDVSVLKDGDVYRMWVSWRPRQSVALVESKDG